MNLLRGLYDRFQVLVHELAKFGVVGAINTAIHFGLYNLMNERIGLGPLTSNGIAIAIAATSSYVMNRHWTFKHRARSGTRREYSLFFLLNGIGWLISQVCLGFTVYVLDQTGPLAENLALVAGVALGMGFRFLTYKRWVFLPAAEPVDALTGVVDAAEQAAGQAGGKRPAGRALAGEVTERAAAPREGARRTAAREPVG